VGTTGLAAARRAVILDPQDPENVDTLGQVLVLLGDLASAERNFLRAIELDANHAPAHLHLGLVYMLQGERQLAYQEWQTVLLLVPGSPTAQQAERLVKNYFP
jgi:Flp pilus assembly protein TadD